MFILHWTRLGWPGEGQQIVIANEQKNCTFSTPPLSLSLGLCLSADEMISPVSGGLSIYCKRQVEETGKVVN